MMQPDKYKEISITPSTTLLEGLKKMDSIRRKLLLVSKNNFYIGLLSIGDIQRAIINNIELTEPISSILRKDYLIAHPETRTDEIKKLMLTIRAEFMPVVADDGEIIAIYFWEEIFGQDAIAPVKQLNLPVVVMAGGQGNRLKPLTNILPKPLIPIGEKTIIEQIMDKFFTVGCTTFYISLNYKAEMIKHYISTLQNTNYHVLYLQEEKPLGTAGSLHLLKGKINSTFFVSNCDILLDQDISDLYEYHRANKNEITLVAALKHYPIPYGILETSMDGLLKSMTEKPELTIKINAGLYLLEPHLINEIPENEFYHITTLVEKLQNEKRKVGVFPVSERSWRDIGEWSEYKKLLK